MSETTEEKCLSCREIYGNEEPPCSNCMPPIILENVLLRKIYILADAQVGVNNAAVFEIIKRYIPGFDAQEYCFEMISAVSKQVRKHINERRAAEQALASRQQAANKAGMKKWLH